MAKTNFLNSGTFLTSDIMNSINGTTASTGLIFDSQNIDGHQPQIPRSGLERISGGTFKGRLFQLLGVVSPTDVTFGYTIQDGLATIWWSDIVIPSIWRGQRTVFYDVAPIMPPQLRPMTTGTPLIIGSAMYLTPETQTSPPQTPSSLAYTNLCAIRIYSNADPVANPWGGSAETVSGCQLEFFKDSFQPWMVTTANTIFAGSVTYQTGNTTYS